MTNEKAPSSLGWVLVWDIDGTLAGDYFDVRKNTTRKPTINPHAIEVLKEAVKAREEGRVDAILYLTNNSDEDFIKTVLKEIDEKVWEGITDITDIKDIKDIIDLSPKPTFDTGLKAGDEERLVEPGQSVNSAIKSFYDVEIMLEKLNKPISNLYSRILFFDDMPDHILTQQLIFFGKNNNFIHITPAFTARNGGRNTKTRWAYVKDVLKGMPWQAVQPGMAVEGQNLMKGGRRRLTNQTNLTKKSRARAMTKKKSRSKI